EEVEQGGAGNDGGDRTHGPLDEQIDGPGEQGEDEEPEHHEADRAEARAQQSDARQQCAQRSPADEAGEGLAEAGGVTAGTCRFVGVRWLLFVPLPVPFPAAPPGAFLGCAPFARVSSSRRSRVLAVGRSAGGAAICRGGSAVCRVPRRGGRALVRE